MEEKERERRRHARYELADVTGTLVFAMDARILNLSLGGVAVETSTRLILGRKYMIKLGDETDSLRVTGTVVRCTLRRTQKSPSGEVAPIYEAAFKFDDVLSETAQQLLNFIEKNVAVELERRLFGRFSLRDHDTLHLASDYDFTVTSLSLSGMRIRSEAALTLSTVFPLEVRLNSETLHCQGRIVHVQEMGAPGSTPVYDVGVEFVDLPPEERRKLEAFINRELEREE